MLQIGSEDWNEALDERLVARFERFRQLLAEILRDSLDRYQDLPDAFSLVGWALLQIGGLAAEGPVEELDAEILRDGLCAGQNAQHRIQVLDL